MANLLSEFVEADKAWQRGKLIDAKYVCCAAEALSCKGIGYISSKAVHIDTRTGKWWGEGATGGNWHFD